MAQQRKKAEKSKARLQMFQHKLKPQFDLVEKTSSRGLERENLPIG